MRLVECVPNFSEGRNQKVLDAIAESIRSVEGVELLDVDPGKATNRTVMTFVGEPEAAVEAAFKAIAKAAELIDMRVHQGAHPRMGATDVCPFVPVSAMSMQDCAELAKRLGARVGAELGIPVYLYAEAAQSPERRNLAEVRKGEYEGLSERMKEDGFKPDFGPGQFNAASGATVIGARPFLIAYNVNLNTKSQKLANEVALSIREGGRAKRDQQGKIVKDASGATVMVPGALKACKAVGWYIDEYQRAQVSINLVDYKITAIHDAFDQCCLEAERLGMRVTGSELVGLTPLEPMLEAGRHYLAKQGRSTGVPDAELIQIAVQSLGLGELSPFSAERKIIEFRVAKESKRLKNLTVSDFVDELSTDSPAPGGGSVAALSAGLSAGLSAMVANLTHAKKEFESSKTFMDQTAVRAQRLKSQCLEAVDADTDAFNQIIAARRLPKDTEKNQADRLAAILAANKQATLVPLSVMASSLEAVELAELMVERGNPNSVSDAGVAGLMARASADGAYYNVLINLQGLEDEIFCAQSLSEAQELHEKVRLRADALHEKVIAKL
jgi:glutamate formiminotransferase/formiminotetrahydrofolate cyclodeaminase